MYFLKEVQHVCPYGSAAHIFLSCSIFFFLHKVQHIFSLVWTTCIFFFRGVACIFLRYWIMFSLKVVQHVLFFRPQNCKKNKIILTIFINHYYTYGTCIWIQIYLTKYLLATYIFLYSLRQYLQVIFIESCILEFLLSVFIVTYMLLL